VLPGVNDCTPWHVLGVSFLFAPLDVAGTFFDAPGALLRLRLGACFEAAAAAGVGCTLTAAITFLLFVTAATFGGTSRRSTCDVIFCAVECFCNFLDVIILPETLLVADAAVILL